MAGSLLDRYGNAGYTKIFIFLSIMMLIGAAMLTIYKRYIKKNNKMNSVRK